MGAASPLYAAGAYQLRRRREARTKMCKIRFARCTWLQNSLSRIRDPHALETYSQSPIVGTQPQFSGRGRVGYEKCNAKVPARWNDLAIDV